jgi:carbamoyltransferase
MRILAFHPGSHDAAAAAFDDYQLIAAVQEGRVTRSKGSGNGVPWAAITEVLRIAGWSRADVEAIATTRAFFPSHFLRQPLHKEIDHAVRRWLGRERRLRDLMVHCQVSRTADTPKIFRSDRFLTQQGFRADIGIHFANHHLAHALAPLFHTDWDDALIYTADGVGDNVSYSIRTLKDGTLDCHYGDDRWLLQRHPKRDSLAWAYGYATEAAGFHMLRDEGKLTGLAARGAPLLATEMARHFRLNDHGLIVADFANEPALAKTFRELCHGHARTTIAASIQKVVEDLMVAAIRHWLTRTGTRHLALGGSLFANVRLNRLLAEACPLDEIFIYPAMDDDGLAVGAGLAFLLERDGLARWLAERRHLDTLYLGADYDGAIDDHLGRLGHVRRVAGPPAAVAADLIASGKVGAAFLGRMEFGPRALGARSILASPADVRANDLLNRRLDRSDFMPFASCVLEEDAERVFEITPVNRYAARFMTITTAVRRAWRPRIPAVIHVDGTARPQILRSRDNPLYADILRRFRAVTGLPVLVNTSFNADEERMVNRPADCTRALTDGRVDFVVTAQAVYMADAAA